MKLWHALLIWFAFLEVICALDWSFENIKDSILGERCSDRWLTRDIGGLYNDLQSNVFGQPFINGALMPLLKRHIGIGMPDGYIPKKALALSFQGSSGVGKTFVARMIGKHLFKKGEESKYFIYFSLGNSWLIDEKKIRNTVIDTVNECSRAIFVFDEIEKMSEGVFEAIKSFLDFNTHIDQVDYRKAIFIFISNIGSNRINSMALSYRNEGLSREKYKLQAFQNALREAVYKEQSGLQQTMIVKNYLIDLYLPFLPLEKEHVIQCIATEAKALNLTVTAEAFENILDDMVFVPPEKQIYSASGCKTIFSSILRHAHEEL